jgi:hypothetical protein
MAGVFASPNGITKSLQAPKRSAKIVLSMYSGLIEFGGNHQQDQSLRRCNWIVCLKTVKLVAAILGLDGDQTSRVAVNTSSDLAREAVHWPRRLAMDAMMR